MNETVQNLVHAIRAGDALETENAFTMAMQEKLSAKLDDMRIGIAQGMFNQLEPVTEEIIELTQEEYDSLSEEDKQEFTLDEGLGKFVAKVVKGASNAVGNVIGGAAKTAGAIRQAPAAIGSAYNRGRAAAQKSIDK
jgi:hypothetical protein